MTVLTVILALLAVICALFVVGFGSVRLLMACIFFGTMAVICGFAAWR